MSTDVFSASFSRLYLQLMGLSKEEQTEKPAPLEERTLSSLFLIVDGYNPDNDRSHNETDEVQVYAAIQGLLIQNGFLAGIINTEQIISADRYILLCHYYQKFEDYTHAPQAYKEVKIPYRLSTKEFVMHTIYAFILSFLQKKIDAEAFVKGYPDICFTTIYNTPNYKAQFDPLEDMTIISIFMIRERYKSRAPAKEYALDEKQLTLAIKKLLVQNGFLEEKCNGVIHSKFINNVLETNMRNSSKNPRLATKTYENTRVKWKV